MHLVRDRNLVEQTGIALGVKNHRSAEAADSAFDPAKRALDRRRVYLTISQESSGMVKKLLALHCQSVKNEPNLQMTGHLV